VESDGATFASALPRGREKAVTPETIRPLYPQLFACERCHQIQRLSRTSPDAWNVVVAYLSQGLLYGREVERPAWFTRDRKQVYVPRPRAKPAKRFAQVIDLLVQGQTRAQIAAQLGLKKNTVMGYIYKIYQRHQVHSMRELAKKLGRTAPPAPPTKKQQVARHLSAGLSTHEIAARMGIRYGAAKAHICILMREAGVKTRRELIEKLGVTHAKR
jgi:DNA-binding CsgD family transcriptional regulator